MTDDDLFPWLRPPPGGLEGLRDRLEARRRTIAPWALVLTAAGVALALALRPSPPAALELDAGLPLGRDLATGPADPTTAVGPPVRLSDGSVLYRVAGIGPVQPRVDPRGR